MGWQPLQPARPIRDEVRIGALIRDCKRVMPDVDEPSVLAAIEATLTLPMWRNHEYQVAVRKQAIAHRQDGTPIQMVHLSIRRLDREPVRDWRDLQAIKNQLLGRECEAVELFPAESRLVDTANTYHLWGFDDPEFRFDVGWDGSRIVDDTPDPETHVVQRKLNE